MRKAGWMFIFLLIHGSSYCWSAPKTNVSYRDYQHHLIEKLALSAPMEMELTEEKFVSGNFNCSRQDIVQFDFINDVHVSELGNDEHSPFIKHSSPRLHVWISVFRN
jgi:hypothetical protein